MSEDVWSEQDTTPEAIDAALRRLLYERHAADSSLAPARVLNLVVVVDRQWKGEIANRLERVGRYHASRTVLCAIEEGRETLDAVAAIGFEQDRPGGIRLIREQVEIDMGPLHLRHLDTIIDPVIVAELPMMLWSPHGHDEATDAVREMIDVMLLDSDDEDDASAALRKAADMAHTAYVVDLAWLRTTPWRERLAASFDPRQRRGRLDRLSGVTIRHRDSSPASALLLAGWLASRLHWEPEPLLAGNGPGRRGIARRDSDEIELALEPQDQEAIGLGGVTVTCCEDFALSLDRASGGLCARETVGGDERVWKVLGASRGEGGILGEGVRQALLRDPTYAPALAAARSFSA